MWRNDTKCKYMFMFPLRNLARKGLRSSPNGLMSEANVTAVAGDADVQAERNWKRSVTPDWGLLTHWGQVTHICVSKLAIIGSDNGLSPERRQAITWTNAGILLIGPLGTNFGEILIEIQTFSLKKIRLKMSSAKCCLFRLSLNVLMKCRQISQVYAGVLRWHLIYHMLWCASSTDLHMNINVMQAISP